MESLAEYIHTQYPYFGKYDVTMQAKNLGYGVVFSIVIVQMTNTVDDTSSSSIEIERTCLQQRFEGRNQIHGPCRPFCTFS